VFGAWLNAAATGIAALAYAGAARSALRRGRRRAVPTLFGLIAVFLVLASLRQVAAALSEDPWFAEADRQLFFLLLVPAATTILPLVHLLGSILSDDPRVPRLATGVAALPIAVGLYFAFAEGVHGPIVSWYGTDWELVSPVTKAILVGVILLPATVGSAWLIRLAREPAVPSRRILLVGVSSLVFFVLFVLDALTLPGPLLILARLGTAAAGVVAWVAYAKSPPEPAEAA
jgi:hypothetical protein